MAQPFREEASQMKISKTFIIPQKRIEACALRGNPLIAK
jgi:hypothetical protein